MSKEFAAVVKFNQEVLGLAPRPHGLQDRSEAQLSVKQMSEEIDEFKDAFDENDLTGCIDACIDEIVFAMGVLYKMGVTAEEFSTIFEVVMNANMTKKQGVKAGREGFGDSKDAIKPEGFVAPEVFIKEIMGV